MTKSGTYTHTENRCDHCGDASGQDAEQVGYGILCSRCLRELDRLLAEETDS